MSTFRRIEPGRYRAIETRVWDLIQGLDAEAARLFLYLWIGPQSQPYGILRFPEGYALIDLAWTPEQLGQAWAALAAADLVWRDGQLVVVVPFLMSNPPSNENIVKSWRKAISSLPDSRLFGRLYERASEWLTEEGLAWLSDKLRSMPPAAPEPPPNRSETVPKRPLNTSERLPKLRVQGAGRSGQRSGCGEQGVEGGEPRTSPPRTSSDRVAPSSSPSSQAVPDEQQRASSHRTEKAQQDKKREHAETFLQSYPGDPDAARYLVKQAGYSDSNGRKD